MRIKSVALLLVSILIPLAVQSEEPVTENPRVLKREVVAHMNRYMTLANQADVKGLLKISTRLHF